MYTSTKLTEYRSKYNVSWAKQLPANTPPEDVVVAYDNEPLFRLIQEDSVMTEDDLKPHTELYPQKKIWKQTMASIWVIFTMHIGRCTFYGETSLLETFAWNCRNNNVPRIWRNAKNSK